MASVLFGTLQPTGDAVVYDEVSPLNLRYPDSDTVDTFGTLWAPRLIAAQCSALELGSAGKVAFSLCNEHSLDVALDRPRARVELVPRNGNSLALASGADLALEAGGTARLEAAAGGIEHHVSACNSHDFWVGDQLVGQFEVDAARNSTKLSVRSVITPSGFDSERFSDKVIYLAGRSSDVVSDGRVTNSTSGIVVVGAPDGMVSNRERFQKSLLWKTPSAEGARNLGTAAGQSNEAYWDLRGGSMRITHVNPSTGGEVSFNLRINHRDELEFVRRTMTPAGAETFEQVLRLGQKRGDDGVTGGNTVDVGTVVVSSVSRVEEGQGFAFALSTFHTYNRYEVVAALYNQFDAPRTAEMLAEYDSGTNPHVVGFTSITPDAVQTSLGTLTNLFISPPAHGLLENVPYVLAVVVRDPVTGQATSKPFTSIVYHLAAPGSISLVGNRIAVADDGSYMTQTPIEISLALSGTGLSAASAIINTTKTLFDWFLQDNPTLVAGTAQATNTFLQFVTANYSDYISFAYAGLANSWLVPEPGQSVAAITTSPSNLQDVKFLRHLDLLVDSASAPADVVVLLPLEFTVQELHAPAAGAAPVDQYGRECGYVRVTPGSGEVSFLVAGIATAPFDAYVSMPAALATASPDASSLVNSAGHQALAAGGAGSAYSAFISYVTDNGVWKVPLDWAQAPVARFGLAPSWATA